MKPWIRLAALVVLALGLSTLAQQRTRLHAQEDEPELTAPTKTALELMTRADDALAHKNYEDAVSGYKALLEHMEKKKNELTDFPASQQRTVRAHAHYNTACALALLGRTGPSLDELEASLDAGFYDWQHLEKDEDLASVRGEQRFKDSILRLRGLDKEAKKLAEFVKATVSDKVLFPFDFEVTTLDLEKLKLSELKGKVVVVHCFGTWNPDSREEVASYVALAAASKERTDPVAIIGLCWERADPSEAIEKDLRDFVAEKKINYPVALMQKKDAILDRIPNLTAFPTTLWIDKTGKVRARADGRVHTPEEIEAVTKALLDDLKKDDTKKVPEKAGDKRPDAPPPETPKPDAPTPDAPKPDAPKKDQKKSRDPGKSEEPF